MKLKSKVEFTSKAGDIKKDKEFTTDASHGNFLINMKYADEIKESKKEATENTAVANEKLVKVPVKPADEGHK